MRQISWMKLCPFSAAILLLTLLGCGGCASSPAVDRTPPEIKKGVTVYFTQTNYQFDPLYYVDFAHLAQMGDGGAGAPTGLVEEVRGNWARLRLRPNDSGAKNLKEIVVWVNFDTVLSFQIVPGK